MASFNSAFASARKSGKKTFTWNGKSFNTKLANDGVPKLPKKVPIPPARPKPTEKAKPVNVSEKLSPNKSASFLPVKTTDTLKGKERANSLTDAIENVFKGSGPGVVRKKYKRY